MIQTAFRHMACFALFMTASAGGCGPTSRVEMQRPDAAGRPAEPLRLQSNRSFFDEGDGTTRLILGWPLPGARVGPPFYQLYLKIPQTGVRCGFDRKPSPSGGAVAKADGKDAQQASGFLVQHRGRNAGRADVSSGWAEISPGSSQRNGRFELNFTDGTALSGTFRATHEPLEVRDFEDQHASGEANDLAPNP